MGPLPLLNFHAPLRITALSYTVPVRDGDGGRSIVIGWRQLAVRSRAKADPERCFDGSDDLIYELRDKEDWSCMASNGRNTSCC